MQDRLQGSPHFDKSLQLHKIMSKSFLNTMKRKLLCRDIFWHTVHILPYFCFYQRTSLHLGTCILSASHGRSCFFFSLKTKMGWMCGELNC